MNIVFDLGGVVVNWLPVELAKSAFSDPKLQTLVRTQVIEHPDWLELDRGSLTEEAAISNAAIRTGLSETVLEGFFSQVAPSLTPIQDTIDLLYELHNLEQHELFVLSNMHHASIDYLESEYDFWPLFRTRVISCRIGMIKPEPDIFEYLLSSNDIAATETVFIDDMPANTAAAEAFGITPILFKGTADCRRQLSELGCI